MAMKITKKIKLKNFAYGGGEDTIKIDTVTFWADPPAPGVKLSDKSIKWENPKDDEIRVDFKDSSKIVMGRGAEKEISLEIEFPSFDRIPMKIIAHGILPIPSYEYEDGGKIILAEMQYDAERKKTGRIFFVLDLRQEFNEMQKAFEDAHKKLEELSLEFNAIDQVKIGRGGEAEKEKAVIFIRSLFDGKKSKEISDLLKLIYNELKYQERLLQQKEAGDSRMSEEHERIAGNISKILRDEELVHEAFKDDVKEITKAEEAEQREVAFITQVHGENKSDFIAPKEVANQVLVKYIEKVLEKTQFYQDLQKILALKDVFNDEINTIKQAIKSMEEFIQEYKSNIERYDGICKEAEKKDKEMESLTISAIQKYKPAKEPEARIAKQEPAARETNKRPAEADRPYANESAGNAWALGESGGR